MSDTIIRDVTATHERLAGVRERLRVDDAAVVADQIAVTEIPAPTGDEGRRAAWVATRMHALGLRDVHIDDAGNVVGVREGETDAPAVVVCAHLDTVFPSDVVGRARHDRNRVFAPGIGDNGRGLAAMLALAGAIDGETLRTRRPVRFVATTGEEGSGDLRGAKHHFTAHPTDAAIALDGTGDSTIVHRAVGSRRFRVSIDGPGGHSWSDAGTANPLHAIAAAIANLARIPVPDSPRTTLNVTRASAGLSVNSIPQHAWFEADIRSTSAEPITALEAALRAIVESCTAAANAARRPSTGPLHARVECIGDRPCGALASDDALVVIARHATALIGREPDLVTGSTDANVPLALGIPAIAIGGGGRGGDVHTPGEWYENEDGPIGVARALTIVVAAANR